jgi:hypothetical protein
MKDGKQVLLVIDSSPPDRSATLSRSDAILND